MRLITARTCSRSAAMAGVKASPLNTALASAIILIFCGMRDPFLESGSPLEQFRQPCDLDDSPRCWRVCLWRGGDTPPRGRDNVLLDSMHPTRDTSVGRRQVSTAGARGHPRNATDDPRGRAPRGVRVATALGSFDLTVRGVRENAIR